MEVTSQIEWEKFVPQMVGNIVKRTNSNSIYELSHPAIIWI
jgi:hypothetical protein